MNTGSDQLLASGFWTHKCPGGITMVAVERGTSWETSSAKTGIMFRIT